MEAVQPLTPVARFGDVVLVETRGEVKLVTAGGVRHDHSRGWGREAANVAGVFEVVEETVGVHSCSNLVLQLWLMIVVAAVIEREGKILIGQRKRNSRHALKWEFPGGKVEAGEEERAALKRELREELGIDAEIGEEMDRYEVQYEGGPRTLLIFLHVTEFEGEPRNLDFEQIVWAARGELGDYDFLEGDRRFNAKLVDGL